MKSFYCKKKGHITAANQEEASRLSGCKGCSKYLDADCNGSMEQEMPKRNQFFSIRPLTASKAKELRIDTLQPRFAAQSVWFRRAAWWVEKLERELLAYPHGAHDDIIDALAYMEQIAHKPLKGNMDSKKIPIAGRL